MTGQFGCKVNMLDSKCSLQLFAMSGSRNRRSPNENELLKNSQLMRTIYALSAERIHDRFWQSIILRPLNFNQL